MATKIHYPAKAERRDATGLTLVGRHTDGRYQYISQSVFHARNVASLTHAERVGLALVRSALCRAYECDWYRVYPMTKANRYQGFGTFYVRRMWLNKNDLHNIGQAFLNGKSAKEAWALGYWHTVAHEAGHNHQDGGRPHGREFRRAEADALMRLGKVLSRGWHAPDMRQMRDSAAPHITAKRAKKKRRVVAASQTLTSKWEGKVKNAEGRLAAWQTKLSRAESAVAKWERELAKAQRWLAKATEKEAK